MHDNGFGIGRASLKPRRQVLPHDPAKVGRVQCRQGDFAMLSHLEIGVLFARSVIVNDRPRSARGQKRTDTSTAGLYLCRLIARRHAKPDIGDVGDNGGGREPADAAGSLSVSAESSRLHWCLQADTIQGIQDVRGPLLSPSAQFIGRESPRRVAKLSTGL